MSTSNWWMYHGDPSHSGYATGSTITSANASTLKLLHDIPVAGPILSVPAVADGFVYVGLANSHDAPGANGGALLKISLQTGAVAARFDWAIDGSEGDSHGFTGMGCTPAVTNGKVYFSAFDGKLYCLDQNTLKPVWVTDLRHRDLDGNQPVSNTMTDLQPPYPVPKAAGWSSPVVVMDAYDASGSVYVGHGEGENPSLFGFVFCLDANTGKVRWIYCTVQFDEGVPNAPNVLPPGTVKGITLPAPFTAAKNDPPVRGCSVWSSIAYDATLNRLYCATGNPTPDTMLPSPGFSNGLLSLDAATGEFKGFFQATPESSYRQTDIDVDVGGSPTLYTLPTGNRRVVAVGCKNGGLFVLDADTLALVTWRQLLPYYKNGDQIPTVDPHEDPADDPTGTAQNPDVPNATSDKYDAENYSGTYSTPAVDPVNGLMFIGVGGNNYHNIAAGIDSATTPFMRAMHWDTLLDAWAMDDNDPPRYVEARPPMYNTELAGAESGLMAPAVVNDVVFCSTSKISVYAFASKTGKMLWEDQLGSQTGGMNGGYGYCMGPAVSGNYVVAGALVAGLKGGVLRIYLLPS